MPSKILIVDDDEASRVGLAMLLAQSGYMAITAGTLAAAKRLLEDETPALMIVDVRLDAFNGLELIATGRKPTPAIVVTGFDDPAIKADARRMGAEYLVKPVEPAALLQLVIRQLGGGTPERTFTPARRWPRKNLPSDIPVQVENVPARVLDVSYGGVRLEVQRTTAAPPIVIRITFPSAGVSVTADVLWTRRVEDTTWLCGAAIAEEGVTEWRQVVDALP